MLSVITASTSAEVFPTKIDSEGLASKQLGASRYAPERLLYYDLLHIDEHADSLPKAFEIAVARLSEAEQSVCDSNDTLGLSDYGSLDQRVQQMRRWRLGQQDQLSQSLGAIDKDQCIYSLQQYAPTALLDGCWMQNFSSAVNSHTEVAAGILKLYSSEIGDGDRARHHGNAFRDLMQSLGVYLPDAASVAFIEQRGTSDAAFRHPVFLLSISQFPRAFCPEILGLTLFYYVCGICPLYCALRDRLAQLGASTRFLNMHLLEPSIQGPAEAIVRVIKRYIETLEERSNGGVDQHWRRIQHGFNAAYLASKQETDIGIRLIDLPSKSPREKMIELVIRKARHAHGYHSHARMEGRSIDDWMNPEHLDPGQFLDALARSRHVAPGDSKGSVFLRHLVAFRGPMFRIFPPDELQVIAEWIDSLAEDQTARISTRPPADLVNPPLDQARSDAGSPQPRASRLNFVDQSIKLYSQMPLGEIYHYLLNIEDYPDVRPFAKHFATLWLAKAGRGLRRRNLPLPFEPYQHQDLESWLEAQSIRQLESYKKRKDEPAQTREELIDASVQLAPMIFIDGAWIQHASNASTSHTAVGGKLFHIYVDEVGNGDVELNHPNVFRELLAQMQVELPEFGTLEFGRCPRFRSDAFRVPVFWLSISQFPKRFFSETLGLNLAMELSGVGGSYRSGIDTLRHYGFDPCFVELHNNIDNVSTGHTRLAVDAIKCHMDEIFARGGADLVDEHWQRVWTGYRALAPQNVNLAHSWSFVPSFLGKLRN
jgi:hypothetical protein